MKNKIIIIGAGGHGKTVCETILAENKFEVAGFVDSTVAIGTPIISGYKVIASQNDLHSLKNIANYFIVAIGNNNTRKELYDSLKQILQPATIIHSSAIISLSAKLGKGNVILAGAIINAYTIIGENIIVNSGVIIDHECNIGSHVHLSIGTLIGSNSHIANDFTSKIGERIESFSKIL